jgi:hypothetical protein
VYGRSLGNDRKRYGFDTCRSGVLLFVSRELP